MTSTSRPRIGDWYQHVDTGEIMHVVSVDAASATVEIQTFDGQLDSIEREDWEEMPLVAAAPPEDWSGAFDDVEADDITEDDSPSDRAAGLDQAANRFD
jgi:hypothetical protein